jgi:hypothetical protein
MHTILKYRVVRIGLVVGCALCSFLVTRLLVRQVTTPPCQVSQTGEIQQSEVLTVQPYPTYGLGHVKLQH